MRENGYSEALIFDFDGYMAELVMYVEAKMNERVEREAPKTPKSNMIQVPKYDSVEEVLGEIKANIQERRSLGHEGVAAMADTERLNSITEEILERLPLTF